MSAQDQTVPETLPFTPAESLMWQAEADPSLRFRIVGVVELSAEPDPARLTDRVERLTRIVPRLRHRVVESPLTGLRPHWELDPHFDLSYHLRWMHLPGGSQADLLRLASQLRQDDFPAGRPPWRMTVVTGLSQGQAAVIMVMNHVITDGIGAVAIAGLLFDINSAGPTPEELGELPAVARARVRRAAERVLAGVTQETDQLGAATGLLRRASAGVRHPRNAARSLLEAGAAAVRFSDVLPGPGSPLPRTKSPDDLYVTLEADVRRLKAAGHAGGGRLNDAYLAALVGGFKRYHDLHGLPLRSVTVTMPVNTRAADSIEHGGNDMLLKVCSLPAGIRHPAARIADVARLARMEQSAGSHLLSQALTQSLSRLPGPVLRSALGALADSLDINTTNVPGVAVPLFLAGAPVVSMFPFLTRGRSPMTAALISYNGKAHIALTIDPTAIPDADALVDCLAAELEAVSRLGEVDVRDGARQTRRRAVARSSTAR